MAHDERSTAMHIILQYYYVRHALLRMRAREDGSFTKTRLLMNSCRFSRASQNGKWDAQGSYFKIKIYFLLANYHDETLKIVCS